MHDEIKRQIDFLQKSLNSADSKNTEIQKELHESKKENKSLQLEIGSLKINLKKSQLENKTLINKIHELKKYHKIQLNKRINDKYNTKGDVEKRLHEIETKQIFYEKLIFIFGEQFGFDGCLFLENLALMSDEEIVRRIMQGIKAQSEDNLEGLN